MPDNGAPAPNSGARTEDRRWGKPWLQPPGSRRAAPAAEGRWAAHSRPAMPGQVMRLDPLRSAGNAWPGPSSSGRRQRRWRGSRGARDESFRLSARRGRRKHQGAPHPHHDERRPRGERRSASRRPGRALSAARSPPPESVDVRRTGRDLRRREAACPPGRLGAVVEDLDAVVIGGGGHCSGAGCSWPAG